MSSLITAFNPKIQRQLAKSRWLNLLLPMAVIGGAVAGLMGLLILLSYESLNNLAEQEAEERLLQTVSNLAQQLAYHWQESELPLNATPELVINKLSPSLEQFAAPWNGTNLLYNLTVGSQPPVPYFFNDPYIQTYLVPLHSDAAGLVNLKVEGEKLLISWSSLATSGWKLVNLVKANRVFEVKNQLHADYQQIIILLAVFLITLFLVLVFLIARRDRHLALLTALNQVKKTSIYPDLPINKPTTAEFINLITGSLMVCQFDAQQRILTCNSAFEHLVGNTLHNLKGQNFLEALGLSSLEPNTGDAEIKLRQAPQQEVIHCWYNLYYAKDSSQGGLLFLLDISAAKQIKNQLESDKQRGLIAEKMKAGFLQEAVNDANRLLLDLMQNAKGFDARLTSYCHTKLLEIQYLLDNLRDMYEAGSEEANGLTADTLYLKAFVEDCYLASDNLLTNTNRRLLIEYGTSLPDNLYIDRRRLFRLVRHLIRQMIQFSGQGDIFLWLGWKDPNQLQIKIYDQGGGVDAQERIRRFQLTTPLSPNYGSSPNSLGLGQLLTKQLIQELKGSIKINNLAKGGLELLVELPAQAAQLHKPALLERILVVDDGPVNTLLASSILEKSGYRVDVANTGAEALALGAQKTYDLILMDIFMPDMNGIQVAQQWRRLDGDKSKVPIIAVTANATEIDAHNLADQGFNAYLIKPYRPNELRELVDKWLHK